MRLRLSQALEDESCSDGEEEKLVSELKEYPPE